MFLPKFSEENSREIDLYASLCFTFKIPYFIYFYIISTTTVLYSIFIFSFIVEIVFFFFLFECLLYVWASYFCSPFNVRRVMGAIIITSIEYVEKSWPSQESNPVPLGPKSSALTIRPRREPLIVFYVQPSEFWSLFKVRRYVIRCIKHDIVIWHCFELLMRLSYYIHPWYGKKLLVSHGDRTHVLPYVSR